MVKNLKLLLCALILFSGQLFGQKIITGTYNLRYDNPGDSINSWPYRKDKVADLIRFYDFDCFGTQEGLHHQLVQLKAELPEYDYVGIGRKDGKEAGEYAAIFYKKDKYEPVKSGTFWLSGTDLHHPNKGWDAVLPRICTWVELKDKQSGKIFYHFNTHFDHVGVKARAESAKLIMRKVREIAGTSPAILTGDFNVDQHSDSYQEFIKSGFLKDAFEVAPIKMAFNGTFNAFNPNGFTESRIDHVFLTDDIKALRYGVLTESYRKSLSNTSERADSDNFPGQVHLNKSVALLPSDHFPVLVQVDLSGGDVASSSGVELPDWTMGPFLRPKPARPVLEPDAKPVFKDPMSEKMVEWQKGAAFNPAAIVKDDKIVVLFRAEDLLGDMKIGGHTSRIGYAESTDGITMKRRPTPVLYPANDAQKAYDWPGGSEDPRVAQTNDGLYVMFYTAWNKKVPRLAVATSRDLVNWKKHGSVFKDAYGGKFFDMASKSASIVTKLVDGKQVIAKVNGKYLLYWGEQFVNLATSDDLIHWTPMVDGNKDLIQLIAPRKGYFDSQLTECGPPAIITDKGILLLYNGKNKAGADGDAEYASGSYCGGQVLFDLEQPTKVLNRLDKPFFVPEEPFEKTGQYVDGTVFMEGMAYFKNKWYLYYGCADSRVGVAIFDPSKK